MKIVITAGGTAGHINPAIALAEELKQRNHQIIFAGTPNRLESKLVPQAGFEFKAFDAKGFNRNHPLSIFSAVLSVFKSTYAAKKWLKKQDVDVVVGFGCYVSLSVCRAAKQLKIPYVIHEQNSIMGMANKSLANGSKAICLTYKRAYNNNLPKVYVTGNPVRKQILNADRNSGRKMLQIPNDALVLLVFGGSLGAKHINQALTNMAEKLLERKNLYIVHLTGKTQYNDVIENLHLPKDAARRYLAMPYQDKMGQTMASSDLCVSRAGASTVAEITALALPSLLIPYPYATENHQFYNAQALYEAGCIKYIKDDQVKTPQFQKTLEQLLDDDNLRYSMKKSFEAFNAKDSVKKLADIVLNN